MDYWIGHVAHLLDVSPQSLRTWEARGLIRKAHRSPTNRRRYTDGDIREIRKYLERRS